MAIQPIEGQRTVERLKNNSLGTLHLVFASASYMAPAMSLFFTTSIIAASVGVHVAAAYIVAAIGIFCTASAVVQFSKKVPSAGSFQSFIAKGLGSQQSFWISIVLVLGYVLLQAGVITVFGWWTETIIQHYLSFTIPWQVLALIGTLLYGYLMIRGVHLSIQYTVALFIFEFVVLAALGITILVRGAPTGHGINATGLLPVSWSGSALKALFLALVFSAYSFIGFEGAASYAEETANPRRNIAIGTMAGVGLIGVLYVFSTWTTALGFPSAHALTASASPYLTLGRSYWGAAVVFIYLAGFTSISANVMAAGNANVRILFNSAREGIFSSVLSHVHPKWRTPDYATSAFLLACLGLSVIASIWWDALTVYGLWSGIGALMAIVAYLASNLAVVRYYFRQWRREFNWFTHALVPLVALIVWGYTLYDSLKPAGFPSTAYPWGLGASIVLGIGFLIYKQRRNPAAVKRIGDIVAPEIESTSAAAAMAVPVAAEEHGAPDASPSSTKNVSAGPDVD